MSESNFYFVKNEILRQNLDEAFDHILTLLPFTESVTYNEAAKSAFRKTIIIYTASIVEALLFYILDKEFTDLDIKEHYSSWQLTNEKILHKVDDSHKIVAGDYKKVLSTTKKNKLNLGLISQFLKEKDIVDKVLFDKIDEIKVLRNEQHIGTHTQVKSYTKGDLERAFSVAKEVKEFVQEK